MERKCPSIMTNNIKSIETTICNNFANYQCELCGKYYCRDCMFLYCEKCFKYFGYIHCGYSKKKRNLPHKSYHCSMRN